MSIVCIQHKHNENNMNKPTPKCSLLTTIHGQREKRKVELYGYLSEHREHISIIICGFRGAHNNVFIVSSQCRISLGLISQPRSDMTC
jgi:hypothetical protein